MPIFIPNPSSTIHESYQTYLVLQYIHISHHNIHTQPISIIQEPTSIQTTPCLVQPLAQAEGSRSGETCSLRRAPFA